MRRPWDGNPSPGWRRFLKQHTSAIWACDFLGVQTIFFKTLYVFFVIDHASREVLHIRSTRHPTAEWVAQQILECCGWDREVPRFLIHDRDSRYGAAFDRRLANLGTDPHPVQITSGKLDRRALGEIPENRMSGSPVHPQ